MNLTTLRSKHSDLNITLAVREIVERGIRELEKEAKGPGKKSLTEKQLLAVVNDIAKTRLDNYNDFRAIIKRCL